MPIGQKMKVNPKPAYVRKCVDCGRLLKWKRGEMKNERHLIGGRSITVRGIEISTCRHMQSYPCLSPLIRLLQAHPRKRVVTWHPKARRWS